MKILVGIKRVVDYNVRVQVKNDGTGVMIDGVKMSRNPFDEIALEAALQLKEAGKATEVVVVSIGPSEAQTELRWGLSLGAQRAIHVVTDQPLQPLAAAQVLKKIVEKEQPGMVLLGKQAIDDDSNQTGQMLAALLDRPQATFASKITVDGNTATVVREVDAGLETIQVDLPAVVTVDLRLAEPRLPKLPDIMKAKTKPLESLPLDSLGIPAVDAHAITHYAAPPKRSRGVMVKDVPELVAALKNKGLL
jgi:electron transfer flavoprotein beta subunit